MTTGLLARVSTVSQRDSHTIDSQKRVLPGIAQAWKLKPPYLWYIDDGISGANILQRPAVQQMVKDIQDGTLSNIVMVDQDRLGRPEDLSEWQRIKDLFTKNNIDLYTSSGKIDLNSIDGEFTADLHAILGRRERQKIRERSLRGRERAQDDGQWNGGKLPWPYYNVGKKVHINEEKRPRIVEILHHLRTHSRADTTQKYNLYQGHAKNMTTKKRLLFYAGQIEDSQGQIINAQWEGIIPPEWVGEILRSVVLHPAIKTGTRTGTRYLLTGMNLIKCSACGHSVGSHTDSRANRRAYYRCNNRQCSHRRRVTPMPKIDEAIISATQNVIENMQLIQQWQAEIHGTDVTDRIKAIENAQSTNQAAITRLVTAITDGIIDFSDAKTQRQKLRKEADDLNEQKKEIINSHQQSQDGADLQGITMHDLTQDEKRIVIKTLLARIDYTTNKMTLHWRLIINAKGHTQQTLQIDEKK